MLNFTTIALFSILSLQQGDLPKGQTQTDFDFWMRTAATAAIQIEETKYRSKCLFEIAMLYAEAGDAETAAELRDQITQADFRLAATIVVARARKEADDQEGCLQELDSVRHLATDYATYVELLRAYIRVAERIDLAKQLVFALEKPHLELLFVLCEEMALAGELKLACATIDEATLGDQDRKSLRSRVGFAVAKAGRVEDTEFVVANLIDKSDDYDRDSLWLKLAEALHDACKSVQAQKYVRRVKHEYIVRTNRRLMARIEAGKTEEQTPIPSEQATATEKLRTEMILQQFGKSELTKEQALVAAGQKDSEIEENLRLARAKPKEPSNGQFGPWNQEGELAKIRTQAFEVSALYRFAGEQEKADAELAEAVKAFHGVVTENAFIAKLTLHEHLNEQVRYGDLKGLQAIAEEFEPEIWDKSADWIVLLFSQQGEVDIAEKLAIRVLRSPTMFGTSSKYSANQLISGFVEEKYLTQAYNILRSGKPEIAGPACWEEAGRLMVEKGLGLLLQTRKWSRSLPPMHRFYIAFGAAKQSRTMGESK
ncbi:MAG: hypothetical protein AAF483_16450 [Planctomycetota bacterium]